MRPHCPGGRSPPLAAEMPPVQGLGCLPERRRCLNRIEQIAIVTVRAVGCCHANRNRRSRAYVCAPSPRSTGSVGSRDRALVENCACNLGVVAQDLRLKLSSRLTPRRRR